jgi:exonuclease III
MARGQNGRRAGRQESRLLESEEEEKDCGLANRYRRCLPRGSNILGGDLNATWDNRPVNENLDVHAMINIPSLFRTNKIRHLCENFNLVDPYRSIFPNKCDFTYVPSVVNNLNRSRIDFFLINVVLIPYVKNCSISAGLLTTHFDHKCIYLNFKKKPVAKTFPIKV